MWRSFRRGLPQGVPAHPPRPRRRCGWRWRCRSCSWCCSASSIRRVHDLPTVVVDQDQLGREPRADPDKLRATQDVRDHRASPTAPTRRAQMIRAGRARVGDRDPAATSTTSACAATSAQVLVLIDGSDSTVSAQALAAINGLVASENLGAASRRRRRPGRAVGAADHPVQPRGADGQLHHPRPGRGAAAARRRSCWPRSRSCASASRARWSSCWSRRSTRSA